jgi:hypothetical protein
MDRFNFDLLYVSFHHLPLPFGDGRLLALVREAAATLAGRGKKLLLDIDARNELADYLRLYPGEEGMAVYFWRRELDGRGRCRFTAPNPPSGRTGRAGKPRPPAKLAGLWAMDAAAPPGGEPAGGAALQAIGQTQGANAPKGAGVPQGEGSAPGCGKEAHGPEPSLEYAPGSLAGHDDRQGVGSALGAGGAQIGAGQAPHGPEPSWAYAPGSLARLPAEAATVTDLGGESLYEIDAGAELAGKTLLIAPVFAHGIPDLFSDHLDSFYSGLFDAVADLPLGGAAVDEWGWDLAMGNDDGLYYINAIPYSGGLSKRYAQATGRSLDADLPHFICAPAEAPAGASAGSTAGASSGASGGGGTEPPVAEPAGALAKSAAEASARSAAVAAEDTSAAASAGSPAGASAGTSAGSAARASAGTSATAAEGTSAAAGSAAGASAGTSAAASARASAGASERTSAVASAGAPAPASAVAVSDYLRVLRERMGENNRWFYDETKRRFGDGAFVGVHPTLWGDSSDFSMDIAHNGLSWWETPRDYAQTDECVAMPIRLALAHKWGGPVFYNMWYSGNTQQLETYWHETWRNARFGGRTHYLGYECPNEPGVFRLKHPGALEGIEAMERKISEIDRVQRSQPDCRALIVFGMEAASNWRLSGKWALPVRGQGLLPQILKFANALFEHFLCDLVPSTEISNGSVEIEGGSAWLGTQAYDAIIYVAPELCGRDVLRKLSAYSAGGGRLLLAGACTRCADGRPAGADFAELARLADRAGRADQAGFAGLAERAEPEEPTGRTDPADRAGRAGLAVFAAQAGFTGLAPEIPSAAETLGWLSSQGIPANRWHNGCAYQDGSLLFTAEGHMPTGNILAVDCRRNGRAIRFTGEDYYYAAPD